MTYCAITVSKNGSAKLKGGYPWVFKDDISNESTLAIASNSDIAHVSDNKGAFLGSYIIDKTSNIILRKISDQKIEQVSEELFKDLISAALKKRDAFYQEPFYRLVNYEGDYMPGISIDRFGDVFKIVTQIEFYKLQIDVLLSALIDVCNPSCVIFDYKGERSIVHGTLEGEVLVRENGISYGVDLLYGQKSGWYYDQRENRKLVQAFAKEGASVLDVFCYSGGFGINALNVGAKSVCFVDSSKSAIDLVARNLVLNGLGPQESIVGDALEIMSDLKTSDRKFDFVVLDPPPMIQNRKHKTQAVLKYKKIASAGLKLLNNSGYLLYSTCSYHMSAHDLRKVIEDAAKASGIKIKHIKTTAHAKDHPVHNKLPETLYLNSILVQTI
jgi:23S rRNA (cytosine1962-C5)-methyltransferase